MSCRDMSLRERAVVDAVLSSLDPRDEKLGLKPEYRRLHEAGCDPTTGFCSVAVEAVWAMLGGNDAGYKRVQVRMPDGGTHWFLRRADCSVLDPTASQFGESRVPYECGVPKGIPVTRKYGVVYGGKEDLLISNKAAYLIEKAKKRLSGSASAASSGRASGALSVSSMIPAVAVGALLGAGAMHFAKRR